ncbi:MAG: sporulation protein YqfD [Syntrophomonadaceae bacterium]|jgi:similar to stage IV sporulation protein
MAKRFFEQVGGIISVLLPGENPEKVINMALSRGIIITDLKQRPDGMHFKIRSSAYTALKSIAEENGYSLEIVDKRGLPFYKAILKRRMGFIAGGIIFILSLYLLSSFVMFIEINGNQSVDATRILQSAARHGLQPGAPKWTFSRSEIEKNMLMEIEELSYVCVEIKGISASIKVVEKVLPKEDITGPCHMVAAKDGVINEILVLEGQSRVSAGDVVSRGDILISGIVTPETNPYMPADAVNLPYAVRARGFVKAQIWYEGYGECHLREVIFKKGKTETAHRLITPWGKVALSGNQKPGFEYYSSKKYNRHFKALWGSMTYEKEFRQEKIRVVAEYSEQQGIKVARQKAMQDLQKKLKNNKAVGKPEMDILSSPSEPIIRVKLIVETSENIAIAEPIIDE